jgi:hypothetical protein
MAFVKRSIPGILAVSVDLKAAPLDNGADEIELGCLIPSPSGVKIEAGKHDGRRHDPKGATVSR